MGDDNRRKRSRGRAILMIPLRWEVICPLLGFLWLLGACGLGPVCLVGPPYGAVIGTVGAVLSRARGGGRAGCITGAVAGGIAGTLSGLSIGFVLIMTADWWADDFTLPGPRLTLEEKRAQEVIPALVVTAIGAAVTALFGAGIGLLAGWCRQSESEPIHEPPAE